MRETVICWLLKIMNLLLHFSFCNDTLVVRAVKDIAIGDEVFNCYGWYPIYSSISRKIYHKILI